MTESDECFEVACVGSLCNSVLSCRESGSRGKRTRNNTGPEFGTVFGGKERANNRNRSTGKDDYNTESYIGLEVLREILEEVGTRDKSDRTDEENKAGVLNGGFEGRNDLVAFACNVEVSEKGNVAEIKRTEPTYETSDKEYACRAE